MTEAHEHVWGPLEQSRFAGTVHRKCTVDGCRCINAYDDEEESEDDHDAFMFRVAGRPNVWQVRCPTCGRVGTPHLRIDAQEIAERHRKEAS